MLKHVNRSAIGASLLAALAHPAQAGPAKAAVAPRAGFDGQWVIHATAANFFCPVKSTRLVAVMQGGQVVKLAGLPGTATGRVADNGAVSVNLKVFGVTATVRGRLTGGVGAGDWSSNSAICAKGGWRAAQSGN
ncbi:hypothetical protein [Methylocystis echinoides]|jgi:hypothetical protein|uniref:hypothetical protein n=1 Tax=Methylocystis echinoides TaxID=29468 RepID=UPI00343DDB27